MGSRTPVALAHHPSQLMSKCKQWRRLSPQHPPPPPSAVRHSVPLDLVGHCFNCLQTDHIATVCPDTTRCLHCHWEGHQAQACKRPWSSDAMGPSRRQQRPLSTVVILNPRRGDMVVATPRDPPRQPSSPQRPSPDQLPTLWGSDSTHTPDGSPSCHILPSPPSCPPPLGASRCRPHFETWVIDPTDGCHQ
jgi:hypothetical protein